MSLARVAAVPYKLAVRAFPPKHRADYAEEMLDTFTTALAVKQRTQGIMRALRFVLAACLDAATAGFGERRHRRNDRQQKNGRDPARILVSWLDITLSVRMLLRYKGLTLAGGFALALAIGIGAAWYDVVTDQLHPKLPFPQGDRIVEVDLRNGATGQGEWRVLSDFATWRQDGRMLEHLSAYRTLERNLILGDDRPETFRVAEITASAFQIAQVPPLVGRTLVATDEQAGAPPVVVLGYGVWQRRFGGRPDAVGQTVQLGTIKPIVVGVMPDGFALPRSHQLWVPLKRRPSGYAPLEGPAVQMFGRLSPGATLETSHAEITALMARGAATSPKAYEHLRARVIPFGAEVLGGGSLVDFAFTHLPILLVLIVACANVGTLIYARTAAREAELSMRHALGASRRRIVTQLFVEAFVLAAPAALIGLAVADASLKWGFAYLAGPDNDLPFWIKPGLKLPTVIYAAGLAVVGAALLGVLPALKATGSRVQAQLKGLATGNSTLQFGKVWTAAVITQVALTVLCIPPAIGISEEAVRDHFIRARFPSQEYLAAEIELDREPARDTDESALAYAARLEQLFGELERRVAAEPGVVAVTFGDRLPGMSPRVRRAEVQPLPPATDLIRVANLWTAGVSPDYFAAFDKPILFGRGFHAGDTAPNARTVIVNNAYARRSTGGNPVGRLLRFSSDSGTPEPWLEIVGVVNDIGMTPTDLGEAPYAYQAVSAATAQPLVMGVRTNKDPATLGPRVLAIAVGLDAGLRLEAVKPLEDLVWSVEAPNLGGAGAIVMVVCLGLFLAAGSIFSLMSVTIARRTREIGLRAALGASRGRLLAGIFSRVFVLVGGGVAAGNTLLLLMVFVDQEVGLGFVLQAMLTTSAVMLTVGFLACIAPARRALRIDPTQALKEA